MPAPIPWAHGEFTGKKQKRRPGGEKKGRLGRPDAVRLYRSTRRA